MNRALAAVAGIGVLVVATAAACTSDDTAGIRTGQSRLATVTEVVEAPATVSARAVATVTAPSAGTVARLFAADGQRVRAGDILAVLASPQVERQLATARRARDAASGSRVSTGGVDLGGSQDRTDTAARQAFATARQAAARIPDATARDATLAQIGAAEAQYAAVAHQARAAATAVSRGLGSIGAAVNALTTAQRLQADTAVELAEAQVDALTLRAPVAGTVQLGGTSTPSGTDLSGLVGQLPAELQGQATQLAPSGPDSSSTEADIAVGTPVGVGTAVATVVDLAGLGLTAEVDETDVLLVTPGTTAAVDLDALPGATYRATVRSVGLLPTTSSRGGVSYRVKLTLGAGTRDDGSAAPQPRPGMSAVARLEVGRAPAAVAVPAGAVVREGDRSAVWVVEGGRAVRRAVVLGTQGEDLVQVRSGLRAGQRIVVAGTDKVRSGQDLK